MFKKIGILALFAVLICFSASNVLCSGPPADPSDYEHEYGAPVSNSNNGGSVNCCIGPYYSEAMRPVVYVSTFCKGKGFVKYQIINKGFGEYINGQYVWKNGSVIDYVETKGSKYLAEEMLKKGYTIEQWIYSDNFLNRLTLGVFYKGCEYRD